MQGQLFRVHHFLGHHCEILNVSVLEQAIEDDAAIVSWEIILTAVRALPLLLSYDLLGFVVDVVNWSCEHFSVFECVCSEHAVGAHVVLVDQEIVVFSGEIEFGLADSGGLGVYDEVVVD